MKAASASSSSLGLGLGSAATSFGFGFTTTAAVEVTLAFAAAGRIGRGAGGGAEDTGGTMTWGLAGAVVKKEVVVDAVECGREEEEEWGAVRVLALVGWWCWGRLMRTEAGTRAIRRGFSSGRSCGPTTASSSDTDALAGGDLLLLAGAPAPPGWADTGKGAALGARPGAAGGNGRGAAAPESGGGGGTAIKPGGGPAGGGGGIIPIGGLPPNMPIGGGNGGICGRESVGIGGRPGGGGGGW
mmetsp:Transcript_4678/g.7246  ORF Transcript_4678/g.7246 Transcript_4678/m.7246 type:complete len:242 (+) Transcript_4678:646-1371(+)